MSERRRARSGGRGRSRAARRAAVEAIRAGRRLTYPAELPITARRDEIVDLIRENQVVVVAGETGSGKSTQIPKMCLEAGRGVGGLIGHTQPRRVAARTIAERVASEIGSELGDDVGYTVRFTDNVRDRTVIKVMTDGILLAEIQRDRMLRRYDTLIIDEAHERSLNIDFILGYLAQLLPQRRDLKVIVTSATIDTERFAAHFSTTRLDDPDGDPVAAPIVEVTGRTFPVEVRYRPFGEWVPSIDDEQDDGEDDGPDGEQDGGRTGAGSTGQAGRTSGAGRADDRDQVQAVVDAVDELAREGDGDVLVFLSGEREIHDTADALRRHGDDRLEVLPLYARLSSAEQHRIFEPHSARRIVLATNVAETSLTVPGVRYVVDAGTARVSRYSKRLKVQRLPIEPVSQASADQRAGRCGRVAPGIAIRLYSEEDYENRPEFTEPEIVRTNLASVILQMTAIGLGDVDAFPFVEPPDSSMVRDGYRVLEELAAIEAGVDATPRLTEIGQKLAALPIDPRLGRMVIEADGHGCVREVLVIAAALSIRDPRERPEAAREKANELHNRFTVDGSDLLSLVALWDYLRERQRALSGNQFRRLCHREFINYLRVREWMDLYSQLRRIAGQLGIRPAVEHGHPDLVHRSVLTGLLSQIGHRDRERRDYRGPRDARFVIARGSVIGRRQPDWVMAAELVETGRLFARRVAAIEPEWIEDAGEHLVKRSHGDPRWDEVSGRAVVTERVTLFGLPIVSDRVVGYDRIDIDAARAWFITKALVEGEWRGRHPFVERNEEFLDRMRRVADRVRRVELVDDEMLFDFFDGRVGADVTSTHHFDRWWKTERRRRPDLLELTEAVFEDSRLGDGIRLADFPDHWRQGDIELPLTYRYAPGEPLDGVTVHVPLSALNQIEDVGFDWQIRGHRRELVESLIRTLPKEVRRQLAPLGPIVDAAWEEVRRREPDGTPLVDVLTRTIADVSGVTVQPGLFRVDRVEPYLRIDFVVADDDGQVLDVGSDLPMIKKRLVGAIRESVAAAAPIEERRGIVTWDVGDLPQVVESTDRSVDVVAYPTLLDVGDSVALRIVTRPEVQRRAMRGGVRRLLLLNAAPRRATIERLLTSAGQLALAASDLSVDTIVDDCIAAAVDESMLRFGDVPWTEAGFDELCAHTRATAPALARDALVAASSAVAAAVGVKERLAAFRAESLRASVADANRHLGRLIRPGFVLAAGFAHLPDIERYVRAIGYRLDHLAGNVERDLRRMADVAPLERRVHRFLDHADVEELTAEIDTVSWQLEELRVSVFAQPIGARGSVSVAKIERALDRLGVP